MLDSLMPEIFLSLFLQARLDQIYTAVMIDESPSTFPKTEQRDIFRCLHPTTPNLIVVPPSLNHWYEVKGV